MLSQQCAESSKRIFFEKSSEKPERFQIFWQYTRCDRNTSPLTQHERKKKMKKDIIIADEIDEQISKLPLAPNVELTCDPMSDLIMDMDIRTTVDSLPKMEKAICSMLLTGYTQKEICKLCKISTAQFQKHLTFIRNRFIEYGFEKHEINF